MIVVTLGKNFFGMENDIEIIFTYASPINSCYTKSRTDTVLDKIQTTMINRNDNGIIMGDLNGRTKVADDFVRDSEDIYSPVNNQLYVKDEVISRLNMDKTSVDGQGKIILELCKSSSYRILNGRTQGDRLGKFTRYPSNIHENPSLIDYSLCSVGLLKQIHSFSVLPFTGLSDHCCISTCINVNIKAANSMEALSDDDTATIHPIETKYTYDKNRKEAFENLMLQNENLVKLKESICKGRWDTQERIDDNITQVNNIILSAAKTTFFKTRKTNTKKVGKVKTNKEWFDKTCKAARTKLRIISRNLSKDPFNKNIRYKFVKARGEYKKSCRKAEKNHRAHLSKQLINIAQNDPKSFWELIGKMNSWGKERTDPASNITSGAWVQHFQKLFSDDSVKRIGETGEKSFKTFEPLLDSHVTKEELKDAFSKLKTGKAVGPDQILTEYLKSFKNIAENVLLKVVNSIFSNHIYPSIWAKNFLKPIYKKSDCKLTDNYRGLAIGSVFAKLFSFILLGRLKTFIDMNKIISPNQIGFMKGSRTSDHIFLLKTLIAKIVKNEGKKLYTAFIDFKKAYDTVDRIVLLDHLKKLGINGLLLQNIEAMYYKTEYLVKYKNGHLDPIPSNVGLKQGCPLSPMLFNMYIDDIVNIFSDKCDPVTLQGKRMSHFLYADDLIILSTSENGLQTGLDSLHDFAFKKHLSVSIDKSKTMIFNKTGKLIKRAFNIGGEYLESVQTFSYLGYEISASGSNSFAIKNLHDKASKAIQAIFKTIARFNIPVKTSIRLFDAYISPIILYNVENWGEMTNKEIRNFGNGTFWEDILNAKASNIHRKFLKYILGVTKSCPNLAVMGETGEIPLLLKGYKLMIQYWYRVTNLPDRNLAKLALLENINLKTNWITTIEKLINAFNLSDFINNGNNLKYTCKSHIHASFVQHWKTSIYIDKGRLEFYSKHKHAFEFAEYLKTPDFEKRKTIAKIRCSDHKLEIEKGRHKRIPREARICKLCPMGKIETEDHFLFDCAFYGDIRRSLNHYLRYENIFTLENVQYLGEYIMLALAKRKEKLDYDSSLVYPRITGDGFSI